jgi:hypothetical protein
VAGIYSIAGDNGREGRKRDMKRENNNKRIMRRVYAIEDAKENI